MAPKMKPGRERSAARRRARQLMHGGVAAGMLAMGACAATSKAPSLDADPQGAPARDAGSAGPAGAPSGGAHAGQGDDAGAAPSPGASGAGGGAVPDAGTSAPSLAEERVTRSAVARNVLYSWTTDKQVQELRSNPVLLTRSESSSGVKTNLSVVLAAFASDGDPLAQVLTSAPFQKGRYGWPNAWANVRGWPGESYGNNLVRIVLKPEAWIVTLADDVLGVIDMNGQPVTIDAALASPERIGLVYFVNAGNDADRASCGTFAGGCGTAAYREYFVNNEAMVQEWSLATQTILDEVDRSIAYVQGVRDAVASGPAVTFDACSFNADMYCNWIGVGFTEAGVLTDYSDALALTSELYAPTADNFDAIIAALEASRFTPDPFVHEP